MVLSILIITDVFDKYYSSILNGYLCSIKPGTMEIKKNVFTCFSKTTNHKIVYFIQGFCTVLYLRFLQEIGWIKNKKKINTGLCR